MKKPFLLLAFVFMTLSPTMLLGENLDSLPDAKRNPRLIEMAKQVVMKHGTGYYHDVFPPVIVHGIVKTSHKQALPAPRD